MRPLPGQARSWPVRRNRQAVRNAGGGGLAPRFAARFPRNRRGPVKIEWRRSSRCGRILMEIRRSVSHWGAFRAEVADGRIQRVLPFELDPAPSDFIKVWPEMLTSPLRVAAPVV